MSKRSFDISGFGKSGLVICFSFLNLVSSRKNISRRPSPLTSEAQREPDDSPEETHR